MAHRLTTCTFCGIGCGIYLETDGRRITGTYPSMSHPANRGRICVRGWHVHEVASSPDRIRHPLIRERDGFREATWHEAVSRVARELSRIRSTHGPDAIGFINSPRCSNEESYLLQKLARAVIGTNNVGHRLGAYRAGSIEVLLEMLGVPGATNAFADVERASTLVVDGVDLAVQLPTLAGRVLRAKLAGATLIVIDPRRHRIAEHADIFLQIRPGTDLLLHGAMAKVIVDRGLADLKFVRLRCANADAFLDAVRTYDLLWVAEACGVSPELIEAAALAYARGGSSMIMYATGAEARGRETIASIVNLALLTGNIGRPGAGVMPLAEQNNLQGCCDMGMLPHRLPGYAAVTDDAARRRFEGLWGAPVPAQPGLPIRDMLERVGSGALKALWIDRHDLTTGSPRDAVQARLRQLEFSVVQHLFMTDTARCADVILPVVAFGEEQVTFTSTERRIQLAEQVVPPPDGPLPAWEQIVRVANALGARWHYPSSAAVMDEIRQAVPAYEAASYENLARDYGRQWPCTADRPLGTPVLCADGEVGRLFTFVPVPRPSVNAARAMADFPFALILGRSLYYWHQNVLVQHSETLRREYRLLLLDYPEGFVDVNSDDARRLGIRDGAPIRVLTDHGSAETYARVTPEVKPGMIFVPYFLHDVIAAVAGEPEGGSTDLPVRAWIEKVAHAR
ncbi:MAG: molybdopterin-dependent oxidoreductase [Armatimonadota bacterium]|nr:molybdopterin-dependent oxidoreductase [Armatimonadota bacterium]